MEQENVKLFKKAQQKEGAISDEELKNVDGGTDSGVCLDKPLLGLLPVPAFKVEEPNIEFDMEGKPPKNLF